MTTGISPSTRTAGFRSAVLATVFSLIYIVGQLAKMKMDWIEEVPYALRRECIVWHSPYAGFAAAVLRPLPSGAIDVAPHP